MTTFLITLGFIAIFFVLMSVRLIFLKNGEFKGTCASQSPYLNKEGATCGLCGKTVDPSTSCSNPDNEVDKVMAKFK
jgi:hypothetical protein